MNLRASSADRRLFSFKEMALLALTVLVLLGVRLSFIHEPFERDEGGYAYIGQELLRGAVPYRDVIDLKPPGTYYYYAVAEALGGQTSEGIRRVTACYAVMTLLATFYAARKFGTRPGLLAALLFALFSGSPRIHGSGCNSEVIMLLPLVTGLCFMLKGIEKESRALFAAAGFCSSVAMLTKTVALPYDLLFLAISMCNGYRQDRSKGAAQNAVAFLTPQFLVFGIVLAWFAHCGALVDFIRWNVTIPLAYVKNGQFVEGLSFTTALYYRLPVLLLPLALAFGTSIWLLASDRSLKSIIVVLLLPVSFIGVWLPGKWFPHYFIQLVPFCAILGGIGLTGLLQAKGRFKIVALPAIAAGLIYFAVQESVYFRKDARELIILKYQDDIFTSMVEVARYVGERTTPEDSILQWGFEPELYFLSGRRSAIPHISAPVLALEPDVEAAVDRMLDTVRARPPRYILVQDDLQPYPGSEQIYGLLDADYHEEARLRYMYVFKRN